MKVYIVTILTVIDYRNQLSNMDNLNQNDRNYYILTHDNEENIIADSDMQQIDFEIKCTDVCNPYILARTDMPSQLPGYGANNHSFVYDVLKKLKIGGYNVGGDIPESMDSQNEKDGTSSESPYEFSSPIYNISSPAYVSDDEISLPMKFTNMVKAVATLTAEQENTLYNAVREAIADNLHEEMTELELKRDQLLAEIGALESPEMLILQYGGDPNVYNPKYSIEIDFSDLKYNTFYMWSRINFVGYYLCDLLSKNSKVLYKHTLEYKVDGSHNCKLAVIKKSKDAVPFIELPYSTSSKQFNSR